MANLNIAIEIAAKDAASSVIGTITNALGGLGNLASGALTVGLGVAAAGVAGLGAGLTLAVSEAMGAQEVMSQTEAVIKSTGGAAGMTADAIAELAGSLSQNSRFADDAIQKGENLLLTFTNIGSDVFPAATQAMVDMATAMGTDAESGAIQLGKALNDPIAGISALSRAGVSFTEDQKKMIEQMVKAGDVAGAQKIILAELNKEFGGSAAASAQTFAGRLDVVKNQLLNVAESIGGPLLTVGTQFLDRFITPALPAIEAFGDTLTGVIDAVGPKLGTFLNAFMAGNTRGAASQLFSMFGMIGDMVPQLSGATDAAQSFIGAFMRDLPNLQSMWDTVSGAIGSVWSSLSSIDLGPLVASFGNLFATVGADMPAVGDIVSGVADGIKIAAQGIADFMNNVLIPGITAVVDWFTVNWPTIKATGEQVMAGLQTAIQTVLTAIQDFWNEWGDDIQNVWQGIVDGVQGVFDLFSLAFEGKWYEFGEKLRTGWDEAWKNIQGIVQSGIDWFNEQDWGAIGTAIIQGIANGITAAAHFIAEAATSAANAAYQAAKGFLGIQSPSKLFFTLGEYSAQGFAEGMGAGAPAMAYASAGAANSAYSGAASVALGGGGSMVLNIDARGASNEKAIEAAAERGVKRGLAAAGYRADRLRRTG